MALVELQAEADHVHLTSTLLPGDRVLLRCSDAPLLVREKILLYPTVVGPLGIISEWFTYAPGGVKSY